jgi:hypothetical protein
LDNKPSNNIHWSSTLTLVVIGFGILVLVMGAAGMGVISISDLFFGGTDSPALMISAFAFGFQAIVLIVCAWFVSQKVRGLEQAENPFNFPYAAWQMPAVVIVVGFVVLIGGVVAFSELPVFGWILLPALTMLAIILPIWVLFGIGSNGLGLGPRWRFFAILGLGMTIGPLLTLVIEGVSIVFLIISGVIYLVASDSPLLEEFGNIVFLLEGETNPEVILELLSPYLTNPLMLGVGIGFIAVFVPLLEEMLKPLGVWLFARRIETPAQGFVLGMLSGAGFALLESLNASADGTVSWPVIVSVRGGASLLHIVTSGLVGWGIVSAFREKRFGRLAAAYLTAVLIHGVWNAAAVGTGITVLGESIGKPEWMFNYLPALFCGLLTMGVGMFAVLIASNRRLRREEQARLSAEAGDADERVKLSA